jgi:hypothetical protein
MILLPFTVISPPALGASAFLLATFLQALSLQVFFLPQVSLLLLSF